MFDATPGESAVEGLGAMAEAFTGKLLIDVANATGRDEAGRPSGLLYPPYLARVRNAASGYLWLPFGSDMELSVRAN